MLKRALSVVVGGVVLAAVNGPSGPALGQQVAHPTGDLPAALVVFPLVVVDENQGIDTVLQLSNAEGSLGEGGSDIEVQCLYVDDECVEKNWKFRLTPAQPTGWVASRGGGLLFHPEFQNGAPAVVPGPDGRWVGELKCYVIDEQELPVPSNNLVGAATIYKHVPGETLDVQSYNGIGLRAVANATAYTNSVLCLGGEPDDTSAECPEGPEYVSCASVLLLDHRFDIKPKADLSDNSSLRTSLSIIPCSEDLLNQTSPSRSLQLLVYNEFEQRYSVTNSFRCRLDKDLRELPISPVFDAAVQGTFYGQTRIRSASGDGLLAIAREYRTDKAGDLGSGALHLGQFGTATQDQIVIFRDGDLAPAVAGP